MSPGSFDRETLMPGPQAFRFDAETRLKSEERWRIESAQPVPRHNQILAALPAYDYQRLLPDLVSVSLPLGWTLHGAGDRERYLYFLTAGVVSRVYVLENGASAEFAVTGSEGAIGLASFLGGESTPSQALVLSAGHAYRLGADVLRAEFARSSPLARLLLRYTQALIAQTGQIAVCNRHHLLEQQLCRWILSCADRVASNRLTMTHELIAHMLGVRREGVTEAAAKLQRAGLIHYARGHISMLDRPGLEAHACECYAVIKREYARMFGREDAQAQPAALAHAMALDAPLQAHESACCPDMV